MVVEGQILFVKKIPSLISCIVQPMNLRPSQPVQKSTVTEGFRGEIDERLEKKYFFLFLFNSINFLFTATLDTGVNLGSISLMKSLNQVCSQIAMYG